MRPSGPTLTAPGPRAASHRGAPAPSPPLYVGLVLLGQGVPALSDGPSGRERNTGIFVKHLLCDRQGCRHYTDSHFCPRPRRRWACAHFIAQRGLVTSPSLSRKEEVELGHDSHAAPTAGNLWSPPGDSGRSQLPGPTLRPWSLSHGSNTRPRHLLLC